jgi:hypothetical protein
MKRVGALAALVIAVLAARDAAAQGVTMLAPLLPAYQLGQVEYTPPKGDGWRQLELGPQLLRLVYAEDPGEGQISLRAEFVVETHPIPDPSLVADGRNLAERSYGQRLEERRKSGVLVAQSEIGLVGERDDLYTYSLISKISGVDHAEVFYVLLAPDKSSYLAAKLATKDTAYDQAPYYPALFDSLKSLRVATAQPATVAPTPAE